MILKGFGTWPHFSNLDQSGKAEVKFQILWDWLDPFQNEKDQNHFKKRLEFNPTFANMGQSGKTEAIFQTHLGRVWPFQNEKE